MIAGWSDPKLPITAIVAYVFGLALVFSVLALW